MFPISRPNRTVRIIANRISSVPLTAVAMAIGLSMASLLTGGCSARSAKSSEGRVGSHQLREKAFVRRAEIRNRNAEPGAAHRNTSRLPDWGREDLRLARRRLDRSGVGRGHEH